jgi:hypothetical protein
MKVGNGPRCSLLAKAGCSHFLGLLGFDARSSVVKTKQADRFFLCLPLAPFVIRAASSLRSTQQKSEAVQKIALLPFPNSRPPFDLYRDQGGKLTSFV